MGEGCSGNVVERYCLGDRNARGDKWIELCGSWEQMSVNTYFRHLIRHLHTWMKSKKQQILEG